MVAIRIAVDLQTECLGRDSKLRHDAHVKNLRVLQCVHSQSGCIPSCNSRVASGLCPKTCWKALMLQGKPRTALKVEPFNNMCTRGTRCNRLGAVVIQCHREPLGQMPNIGLNS